jgi:hypothetical protein
MIEDTKDLVEDALDAAQNWADILVRQGNPPETAPNPLIEQARKLNRERIDRLFLIDLYPPVRMKVWAKDSPPLPTVGTTIVSNSNRGMVRYRVLSVDRNTREVVLVDEDAITAARKT